LGILSGRVREDGYIILPSADLSPRLVANPLKITLRDLLEEYENVTYPITLVCAGNRRKEQNVVRKSKGFSWGPAGVSTALFTGVVMKDIIECAKPLRKAKYVCMEGADKLVSLCLMISWHI
jgi:nitrate reductase (NAD(P)H)